MTKLATDRWTVILRRRRGGLIGAYHDVTADTPEAAIRAVIRNRIIPEDLLALKHAHAIAQTDTATFKITAGIDVELEQAEQT